MAAMHAYTMHMLKTAAGCIRSAEHNLDRNAYGWGVISLSDRAEQEGPSKRLIEKLTDVEIALWEAFEVAKDLDQVWEDEV